MKDFLVKYLNDVQYKMIMAPPTNIEEHILLKGEEKAIQTILDKYKEINK